MSATAAAPAVLDEAKLNAFVGKMVGDIGATLTGALVIIGDRLGLYRALAEHGAVTSAELAEKTGTHERYVRGSRCRRNTVLYQIAQTLYTDEPAITEAFKTGRGFGWHEHDHRLFAATERFFRPGYNAHLIAEWIPAPRCNS